MESIYITRKIPQVAISLLEKHFHVRCNLEDRDLTTEELLENTKDCAGIISMLTNNIPENILEKNKNLKIIANYAVGYNNFPKSLLENKNITLTNTPDVLTTATAELAFALLINISRSILESDNFTRSGKFLGWTPTLFLSPGLHKKKLGIIGLGRIGQEFLKMCQPFQMDISYYNRNRKIDCEKKFNISYKSLRELLKTSDYVVIHAPYNDDSHHLIKKEEFLLMKNSSYIINTARGAIIKEADLLYALENGLIKGAALDVFEYEPEITKGLINLPNTILTPHIGSSTFEARENMALLCAQGIIDLLINKIEPVNKINL